MSTPTSDGPEGAGSAQIDPSILAALRGLPQTFDHFAALYQNNIQPELQRREKDRQFAAKRARQWTWIGAIVGGAGISAAVFIFRVVPLAVLSGIFGYALYWTGQRPLHRLTKEAKPLLVQPIAEAFGLDYDEDPGHQPTIEKLAEVGVLPGWDRATFEDRLAGTYKDVPFEFFEAHLEDRRTQSSGRGTPRKRWVTVFNGQCMRFRFDKQFLGRTIILRDAGMLNRFGGNRKLQKARLESPEFEQAFEVFTSDQVEARYLLTPDIISNLNGLERSFGGRKLRCAFDDGDIIIVLEHGNLFEPGSLMNRLDDPDRVRELLDDFASVFRFIDALGGLKGRPI